MDNEGVRAKKTKKQYRIACHKLFRVNLKERKYRLITASWNQLVTSSQHRLVRQLLGMLQVKLQKQLQMVTDSKVLLNVD